MALPAFSTLEIEEKKLLSPPSDHDSDLTAIASSARKRRRKALPMPPPPLDCEIDALVHLHTEQLKAGIAEIHRRQYESLAFTVETRLREREAQAERLWLENAALQEKLRAVSLQNQQLLFIARRSEAMAAALRGSLEAVVRQNEAAAREREGCGDSGEVEEAQSCCGGEAVDGSRYRCRLCGEREVSVMLMPCHHLCLCGECEGVAGECPCCRQTKRAALQVFL